MSINKKGFPIGRDAKIEIATADLSTFVRSGAVNMTFEEIDVTGFGDFGHQRQPGLRDDSFDFTLMQSFAASEVDATLSPLFENETEFLVRVTMDKNTSIAVTNPAFEGTCKLFTYPPFSGEVGNRAELQITLPVQGKISRVTDSS